ncbi:TonB-dependent receptor [Sphingomonas sp. ERG5]|uniref:TonB-dependent receptor n=1 Tax=Sphingomonas sp. ERG5 TaxID=1381597 RepID=UPI0009DE5E68|nr:TonB-dependent receptor [Sphingomonas sp. ERG5]
MRTAMKMGIMATTALLMTQAAATAAFAQQAEEGGTSQTQDTGLDDIVVTAQKRAQNVQKVPLSITVLGADQIEKEGFRSFQDYATRVPNLSFSQGGSSIGGLGQAISLRGIYGTNTTGVYLDETPLPGSVDPQVIDLERIEVLRGPQGTLYGARSMGGTVRLITHQPDLNDFSGSGHGIISSTHRGNVNNTLDGSVNIPLVTDTLGIRAFGFWDYQSGVFTRVPSADAPAQFSRRNNVGSTQRYGGAIAARLQFLDDAISITPRVVLQRTRTNAQPYADVVADNFVQKRLFDLDEGGSDDWELFSLTSRYGADFGEFISVTSQFNRDVSDSENASEAISKLLESTTPSLFRGLNRARTFAQEFRFTSDFKGPLQITLGAFYQKSSGRVQIPPNIIEGLGDLYNYRADNRTVEKAIYGEANFDITDKLQVIAGLRYFRNSVNLTVSQGGLAVGSGAGTFNEVQRESGFNPRFGIKYAVSRDINLFANAAKGFRIGGANGYSESVCAADRQPLGISAEAARSYRSDSVWSYEAGVKSSFMSGHLVVNATAFRVDWSNIQQNVALACGFSIDQNGGRARSEGFELELQASPVDGLIFGAGIGHTNARITDPGALAILAPGTRIQQVPRWNLTGSADYKFAIGKLPLTFHGDVSHVGSSLSRSNLLTGRTRPAYELANLRFGTDFRRFNITFFVENVFDKIANLADVPPLAIEDPNRPRIAAGRPRTIGIDARAKF